YGVILGIFLVAFWIKHVKANATFFAAVIAELLVILIYKLDIVSFLWLNVIGALLVISISLFLQLILPGAKSNVQKG
ncbi:MAG: sodium:solute symporter, partial [Ferruginibacter sp.]